MEFDSGASSAGTDYGGFRVKLSDREKYYLRAAGIPPHLLNNNDRAAVIRSLMMDNELIEDHKAGGFASFVFKMGGLRDMLEHTQAEIIEEDFSDLSGLDAEEQAMKSQGYTKDQILAFRRRKKEEELEIAYQRQCEYNVIRANEEERLRKEALIFEQQGAARYAQMNPIPPVILGMLLAEQLGGVSNKIKLDDDGKAIPLAENLHPDMTPQGRQAQQIQAEQTAIQTQRLMQQRQNELNQLSIAMDSRPITLQRPIMDQSLAMAGRMATFQQPEMNQSVVMAGKALQMNPSALSSLSFKFAAEDVKDNDPTHLVAPMQDRKVQHEAPSIPLPPLPNKH